MFEAIGHSVIAIKQLADYHVGELLESETAEVSRHCCPADVPVGSYAVQAARFNDFAHVGDELNPIVGLFGPGNPDLPVADALAPLPFDMASFVWTAKRWAT